MSRQEQRGLWSLRVAVLALGLIGQSTLPAMAWQGPDQAGPTIDRDVDLPWRIDLDQSEPRPAVLPIGSRLHPRLLELFREKGLQCTLEGPVMVLRRERSGQEAHEAATDDIPIRLPPPGDATELDQSGWIQIDVPPAIKPKSPGESPDTLTLTIRGWSELRARVGAGVFRGTLVLRLENPDLHGGRAVRLFQKVALVLAGSRVVSSQLVRSGPNALKVGDRPRVKTILESVHKVGPNATDELDPGWWLEVNDTQRTRGDRPVVLARLPLPIRLKTEPEAALFRLAETGDDRGWDTSANPEGYERDEGWANEVILQRLVRDRLRLDELDDVRVQRITISTYLPALFQPGQLGGEVFWDPAAQANRPPRPADGSKGDNATKTSVAGVGAILSGLRVSTDMPVTEESFDITAVIDLGTDARMKELAKQQDKLDAVIWKLEKPPRPIGPPVKLDREDENPNEPNLVRYRGSHQFERGQTGEYEIRLVHGDESLSQDLGDPMEIIHDKALIAGLKGAVVPVRVLLQGVSSASPLYNNSVKVFTDSEPFWWLPTLGGEPGFSSPFANGRTDQTLRGPDVKSQVFTSQALAFRWAAKQDDQLMGLRYQGIVPDRSGREPKIFLKKWQGASSDQARHLDWMQGVVSEGQEPPDVASYDFITLKYSPVENDPFQFVDFQVNLTSIPTSQDQAKPEPLAARFLILGRDANRPFGRVYQRRFDVVVESWWNEVDWEYVTMAGAAVAFGGFLLYRRSAKRKRKLRATRVVLDDEEAPRQDTEKDYFSGLAPSAARHDLDLNLDGPAPPEPPPSPRGPAAPAEPAAPSYLEETRSEGDGGAPSYLD